MNILGVENKRVKKVLVKKLDFHTVIALAMVKKSDGSILVEKEDAVEEDFIIEVSYVSEEGKTFNVIYKSLKDVVYDFVEAYNVTSYEAKALFVNDFVKSLESSLAANKDATVNSIIKCMNSMLNICFEDMKSDVLLSLIEIANELLETEVKRALTKLEEYYYFGTFCKVEDKVIILERMVNPYNLATYLNEANVDVEFAVIHMQGAYKYTAIPIDANISIPRKKVPDIFSKNPIERIREITGAESLKYVNKEGFGGVCGTLEDAVRIATLAANV